MQDYNYLHGNCMEVTFELSCCKHPLATELHKEWDLNRESLLAYMEKVNLTASYESTASDNEPLSKCDTPAFLTLEKLFLLF